MSVTPLQPQTVMLKRVAGGACTIFTSQSERGIAFQVGEEKPVPEALAIELWTEEPHNWQRGGVVDLTMENDNE